MSKKVNELSKLCKMSSLTQVSRLSKEELTIIAQEMVRIKEEKEQSEVMKELKKDFKDFKDFEFRYITNLNFFRSCEALKLINYDLGDEYDLIKSDYLSITNRITNFLSLSNTDFLWDLFVAKYVIKDGTPFFNRESESEVELIEKKIESDTLESILEIMKK